MKDFLLRAAFLLSLWLTFALGSHDIFDEELSFTRLQSGHLLTHFQFTTKWDVDGTKKLAHFDLFPKSLMEIIQECEVNELHLTLTQGAWHHDKWGHASLSSPAGAELWVWFAENIDATRVEANWNKLINALSGQLCASINFITTSISATPSLSFRPLGVIMSNSSKSISNIRYAHLAKENVCTENLTPWKKLLPCVDKAGLASLLNAVRLYDTNYHALGVNFRRVCRTDECNQVSLELKQTLDVVFDPVIAGITKGWHLIKLFNSQLKSRCPLARNSKVYIDSSEAASKETLSPAPSDTITKELHGKLVKLSIYDLKDIDFSTPLNIASHYAAKSSSESMYASSIKAHRYITGYGEEYGGITSHLLNKDQHLPIKVIYFEVIPWFVRIYLHTLKVTCNGSEIKIDNFSFIPSKDRLRPTTMEMVLSLPPASTVQIHMEFEKAFLKWTEYPPDSHHGFYVSPAVISTILPNASNFTGIAERCFFATRSDACQDARSLFVRIYTEPLLVLLPTPDFSMPYNVICLSCTVIAIGFGTLYNLTTRSFQVIPAQAPKSKSLKARLLGIFSKKESITDSKKTD